MNSEEILGESNLRSHFRIYFGGFLLITSILFASFEFSFGFWYWIIALVYGMILILRSISENFGTSQLFTNETSQIVAKVHQNAVFIDYIYNQSNQSQNILLNKKFHIMEGWDLIFIIPIIIIALIQTILGLQFGQWNSTLDIIDIILSCVNVFMLCFFIGRFIQIDHKIRVATTKFFSEIVNQFQIKKLE
jgi:hypothetical protein